MKETKRKLKTILVIVAHPDDETIWMGGTLLKNKNKWDTTIISLCRKNDKDRAPKFKQACEILNSKYFISDLDDSEQGDYKKITNEDIINRILSFIKEKDYDFLFTHGKNGEYRHIRHIQVHDAVNEMLKKKLLTAKKVLFFSYQRKKEDKICYANSNADKFIRLTNNQFNDKKKLIQEIYGFEENSFENLCCLKKEAFDIKNIK